MNRKFLTLYRFNLLQKLRAKSFLISTVLMVLFLVGFGNIERILDWFSGDDPKVALVSELSTDLRPALKKAGVTSDITTKEYTVAQARKAVDRGTFDAVAIVQDSYDVTLVSASPESELQTQVATVVKQVRDQAVITDAEIDPNVLASLAEPVPVKQELTSTGGKSEDELFAASALVYVLLFLMYFTIAIYGGMIVTEIANEKSSRVMELLISAASPIQHMLAKILSIATVSLVQLSILVGVGYYSAQNSSLFDQLSLDSLSARTIIYLFVFFLLGYFLYATLLAALGSLVSRVEDAQQVTLPVILLIVAAFMISMFSLNAPTNQAVVVLSFVPFFTPMVMFLRVMLTDVPLWQVSISLILMLISISLALFVGTKFYRGGVLFYGSNPLKQLRRILSGRR
ncbi:ABC transporter [Exiguobacterium sp. Leaf187]|uniref:ABC transporter n=1 Tax=Exiguobacterium indicum TaxID=296995 RepID=A0A0V8GIV4_9BACL|nr:MULTISPECIES: ABC transporter permease [Exiguobacterium]AHA30688.1 ABC transporter [Exiguobacterium sp. MH3]KQS19927.1 ABC transporter [Exiguobacterium sp. Leaf187]KSU50070.1 ABC transporter [Exiguobacterium enclense]KTR27510.1 ABC transporter [Exiguobacterium indicum]NTY10530.1 ABC transporter permease [Exiguobacterium sp. JMULE1]